MKRIVLLAALGLAAGCANNQPTEPAKAPETPAATPTPTNAQAPAPAIDYPSHDSEPGGLYFESRRNGVTYVTAYESTNKLIRSGQIPPYMVEKKNFGPSSDTVCFESDGKGLEARLEKDYLAQHK